MAVCLSQETQDRVFLSNIFQRRLDSDDYIEQLEGVVYFSFSLIQIKDMIFYAAERFASENGKESYSDFQHKIENLPEDAIPMTLRPYVEDALLAFPERLDKMPYDMREELLKKCNVKLRSVDTLSLWDTCTLLSELSIMATDVLIRILKEHPELCPITKT